MPTPFHRTTAQAATRMLWWISAAVLATAVLVLVISLSGSTAGERAAALGSLIGGAVGAAGAILAVFLMLSRQREEESAKVAGAVKIEVATLSKYVIGSIEICLQIKAGVVKIPRENAFYIVKAIAGDPVVYPAVADRVGLLPHPQATTEFYMRLSEAKAMVDALRTKKDVQGITYQSPPTEYVTAQFAASIADSLITALQLARPIIDDRATNSSRARLADMVRATVVAQIDTCLESAKVSFPDAESFRLPSASA
jgi:hypothetical protein